ncbi:hypothetical protein Q7409_04855 [Glaesserella parasuis]|nr:hypothetical protein [Glaesserella parasuis]MDO9975318.1 hypothetical protein [Glaesserella parasuis]MDP0041162.1 hypothetical protein [Glaesserella parasuis]
MNVQQFPFSLQTKLINNRQQYFISLKELAHVAFNWHPTTKESLQHLNNLGFQAEQDYLIIKNKALNETLDFWLSIETAISFIDKTTDCRTPIIKRCLEALGELRKMNKTVLSELQPAINQQRFIVETNAFLNTYFQYDHHFLISEDDFVALERMKGACTAFEQMLLEMNDNRSLSYEALADLFSCCTAPLFDVLKRIKDAGSEVNKIQALASN